MTRRSLIGLGLAAGGLILGLRAWQGASREVKLRYEAPAGELTVTIRDAEGRKVRRATFGGATERQHAMRLPEGQYTVLLELPGRDAVQRVFGVAEDAAVLVEW